MGNEDRQKKINELKALRAELLAYKEAQEESEEGNASSETIANLRRTYTAEMDADGQDSNEIDSIQQAVYEQYGQDSGDDYVDLQQKSLTRRR